MSKPPIKAMKAVKRYCEKKKTCDGCPLHSVSAYGYLLCFTCPGQWTIKKEGDTHDGKRT